MEKRQAKLPDTLQQRVFNNIPHHLRHRPMLVGFSGGLDSTVLLHLLTKMRDEGRLASLRALHVHHGLQSEADAWLKHCKQTAEDLQIPFQSTRVTVDQSRAIGLEASARSARYRAMEEAMEEGGVLLTAHHLDDQAETFLLQLLRGAGVRGMASMPRLMPFGRGWHLRPMLDIRRTELLDYAHQRGLIWQDDPSNADTRLARNHLRHQVIPKLQEHWPQATLTLARAASRMAQTESLLNDLARIDLEPARTADPTVIHIHVLHHLSLLRALNVLRLWIDELGLPMPPEGRLEAILHMLKARPDAVPFVEWAGIRIYRWHEHLHIVRALPSKHQLSLSFTWGTKHHVDIPELGIRLLTHRARGQGLSVLKLHQTLEVRTRKGGETIRLHPNGHRRAIKNLMQEADLPPWERERLPFIYSDDVLVQVGTLWLLADARANKDEEGLVIDVIPIKTG